MRSPLCLTDAVCWKVLCALFFCILSQRERRLRFRVAASKSSRLRLATLFFLAGSICFPTMPLHQSSQAEIAGASPPNAFVAATALPNSGDQNKPYLHSERWVFYRGVLYPAVAVIGRFALSAWLVPLSPLFSDGIVASPRNHAYRCAFSWMVAARVKMSSRPSFPPGDVPVSAASPLTITRLFFPPRPYNRALDPLSSDCCFPPDLMLLCSPNATKSFFFFRPSNSAASLGAMWVFFAAFFVHSRPLRPDGQTYTGFCVHLLTMSLFFLTFSRSRDLGAFDGDGD